MSTLNEWRGDAPAVAQVIALDPPLNDGQVEFYIGGRPLGFNRNWSVVSPEGLAEAVQVWNSSKLGEFREIVASEGGTKLLLTAKEAGRPFAVTTTVGGLTTSNEIQTISLTNATGGTFTLSYLTETTSAIAYNASAATLQSALEALSAFASGDVLVSKVGSVWTVSFAGAFLATDIAPLRVNFAGLTGGTCSVVVTATQSGVLPTNTVQVVSLDSTVTGGTATLTWMGATTSALAYNASASTVQTAVDTAWGENVVTVTGSTLKAGLTFTFDGTFAGQDVALIIGTGTSLTGGLSLLTVSTVTAGVAGTDASYNWKLGADPSVADSSGNTGYKYRFVVATGVGIPWRTRWIDYSESAAAVQVALEQMVLQGSGSGSGACFGAGNVTVSGTLSGSWVGGAAGLTVTLGGRHKSLSIGMTPVPAGVGDPYTNNRDAYITGSSSPQGAAGTNEVQKIQQSSVSSVGTFRIVYDGIATQPIEYCAGSTQADANAWAQNVRAALAAHPSIGTTGDMTPSIPGAISVQPSPTPGLASPDVNVGVYGYGSSTPYIQIKFTGGGLQSTNVSEITVVEAATVVYVSKTTTGTPGRSAKQRVEMTGAPWGGTWTLKYSGQTTSGQVPLVTAWNLQLALEALSNLVPGDIAVSGSYPVWNVTFAANLGDVQLMIGDGSSLRNGNIVIATTNQGGLSIVQRLVRRSRGPWHGDDPLNWTLGRVPQNGDIPWFRTGTTGPRWGITWLAPFTVDSGDSTLLRCSGDFVDGQAIKARSSGTLPTGLTAGTTYYVRDWDNSTLRLSASLDGAPISLSGGSGTHEIFTQLDGFKSFASWTPSDAGLGNYITDRQNGFREYRATYFKSGWATGAKITAHEGVGSGAGMFRIDTDTFKVVIELLGSGGAKEQGLPTVLWIGRNADNVVNNYGASLGIGLLRDEVVQLKDYIQRSGSVSMGPGVTFTAAGTIDVTGGTFRSLATVDGAIWIRG